MKWNRIRTNVVACLLVVAALHNGRLLAQRLPAPFDDALPAPVQELPLLVPPSDGELAVPLGRAHLGVTFDPSYPNAAVARSIAPGSPAEQAGLRAGDTIETLNGQTVATYQDVLDAVRWMKPGDSLDIVASRRVSIRTQAVLEAAPNNGRRTTNLSAAPDFAGRGAVQASAVDEQLPIPEVTQNRAPRSVLQPNTNSPQPRRSLTNQDGSRGDSDRANRRSGSERNSRERGLFQRRRN